MNIFSYYRAFTGSIHLASAALCLTLFNVSVLADDDKEIGRAHV